MISHIRIVAGAGRIRLGCNCNRKFFPFNINNPFTVATATSSSCGRMVISREHPMIFALGITTPTTSSNSVYHYFC